MINYLLTFNGIVE